MLQLRDLIPRPALRDSLNRQLLILTTKFIQHVDLRLRRGLPPPASVLVDDFERETLFGQCVCGGDGAFEIDGSGDDARAEVRRFCACGHEFGGVFWL